MRRKLTGRLRTRSARTDDYFAEFRELLDRDRTAPQDFDPPVSKRHDCRFDSMYGRTGVDDQWNEAIKLFPDVLGSGGADPPESIRARCGERSAEFTNHLAEDRMRANSNCDCVETSGHNVGDDLALGEDDCEWSRPKSIREFLNQLSILAAEIGNFFQPSELGHMNNERIETRTFLCLENFRDCDRVQCVGREPVNCFGGQCDDFAVAQERDRFCVIRRRDDLGLHFGTRAASTDSVCFFRNFSRFLRIFSSERARIAAASKAAFFAPASPMASVPTGMPPGICAIDKSESRPCNAFD